MEVSTPRLLLEHASAGMEESQARRWQHWSV